MARWRELHDIVSRERYPHLVSFAALVTGSDDSARELVDAALIAELSRGRPVGGPAEVEEAVRMRVARAFVGRPEHAAPAVEAPVPHAEASTGAHRTPEPPVPDPAVFAPPGDPRAAERGEEHAEFRTEVHESPAADQDRTVALADALATLAPLERTIQVLHHVERLTPQRIARALGTSAGEVRSVLESSGRTLARLTGLASRPATHAESEDSIEVTVTVSPAGRA